MNYTESSFLYCRVKNSGYYEREAGISLIGKTQLETVELMDRGHQSFSFIFHSLLWRKEKRYQVGSQSIKR